MRILLVEDDSMIGEAVVQALHDAAYAVDWVKDGHAALLAIETNEYGMVLLDLGLPRRNGLDLLRQARAKGHTVPVIIVTARDALEDRVVGLDLGADDYLAKPFDVPELLARMRAVARRRGGQATPLLTNGTLTLDPATHEARYGEASCSLTAREFSLLQSLLLRPGAILSRSELEERVYGWNEEVESNAIEFLIHGVRRKLGMSAIKNVRGVGWMVPRES